MSQKRVVSGIPRSRSLSRHNSDEGKPNAVKMRPRTALNRTKPRAQSEHGNLSACFIKQEKEFGLPAPVLKQARKTGHLNLSNKGIIEVPDIVWNLNTVGADEPKKMSISFDTSVEEGDRWWDFIDLTKLILASNKLSFLPTEISNLTSLTVLDLHDNQMTSLPESLRELKCITKLDISRNRFEELPDCIFKLTDIRIFLAHSNKLQELNDDIGNLSRIEELNLSNNNILKLPNTIGFLSRTVTMNLAHNKLEYLPNDLISMTSLKTLDLSHNNLVEIPEDIGCCINLQQLYLRHNNLTSIPDNANFPNLKELQLGNNHIKYITASLCQCLVNIKALDLRDNKISELPEEIGSMHSLERFDLTNNSLVNLPSTIASLVHLKSLCLEGNPLRSIRRDILQRGTVQLLKFLKNRMEDSPYTNAHNGEPPSEEELLQSFDKFSLRSSRSLDTSNRNIRELPKQLVLLSLEVDVTVVDLSKNSFTEFPENLEPILPKLTELKFGFNKLSSLPLSLGLCTRLMFLDLRNNQLSSLPTELSSAQELRELNISFNKFSELPLAIYALTGLEILFAGDNCIQSLDAEKLTTLNRLATFDLTNNDITKIPPELGNMKNLRSLQLEGNPSRFPRPAVLAKGTQFILEYLRDRIPQ